ncbi:MAG: hypothetical protein Ct9H300mP11_24260 [Chloroflexota bacterium]|nr:MAG: hypothetical protein Ct9H300mP11_24260 [Chloroflexota bacterium]
MDPTFIDLLCRSFEFKLPLAGSRPIRSNQSDNACVGLRYYMGPTENDHATEPRPPAGRQSDDDVVVDATHDCLFLIHAPKGLALYWTASNVLGIAIQYFVNGGWGLIPSISQSRNTGTVQKTGHPEKSARRSLKQMEEITEIVMSAPTVEEAIEWG